MWSSSHISRRLFLFVFIFVFVFLFLPYKHSSSTITYLCQPLHIHKQTYQPLIYSNTHSYRPVLKMDFVKNLTGGSKEGEQQGQQQSSSSGGGFTDKLNSMAGGGSSGEKKEDGLDKGESSSILLPTPSSFLLHQLLSVQA